MARPLRSFSKNGSTAKMTEYPYRNEPQLKATKRRIAEQFEHHAPDRLKETIRQLLTEW